MKIGNTKDWSFGIIVCALFGTGEWLLGYVAPTPAAAEVSVIKAGYGADMVEERVRAIRKQEAEQKRQRQLFHKQNRSVGMELYYSNLGHSA